MAASPDNRDDGNGSTSMHGMSSRSDTFHVLALDYSPEVLNLISDVLAEAGFRVTTRLLPDESLESIVSLVPDVILMDYIHGREEHGRNIFAAIKRDPRTASLPLILCTGAVPETEDIRNALEQQGVRVLYKPFDIDDLVCEVRSCLGVV